MNILITGGAGFIGSNLIRYLIENTDHQIVNLDLLTYAGNLKNLEGIDLDSRYRFIFGDICDKDLVKQIFDESDIDIVVNLAAESHVDRSIEEPEIFIKTNVMGTQTLLEAARKKWKAAPHDKHDRKYKDGVRFIQVSTDEVYGSLGEDGSFSETTPIAPNSPYSSSKASADMLVMAYWKTYGFPAVITRCSNNFGPYQHPEKLIPLVINNAIKGKEIPVYGNGEQIRDWLYVEDHCSAIYTVIKKGKAGEIYNIGGNNEIENIRLVRQILRSIGKSEDLIRYVTDRPGHDKRYAINCSKISCELDWKPSYVFDEGLHRTVCWYLGNKEWLESIVSGEYRDYYDRVYKSITN